MLEIMMYSITGLTLLLTQNDHSPEIIYDLFMIFDHGALGADGPAEFFGNVKTVEV